MDDPLLLSCSLLTGASVAVITFTNRGNYSQFLDFVERDLAFRLRSMRAKHEESAAVAQLLGRDGHDHFPSPLADNRRRRAGSLVC